MKWEQDRKHLKAAWTRPVHAGIPKLHQCSTIKAIEYDIHVNSDTRLRKYIIDESFTLEAQLGDRKVQGVATRAFNIPMQPE